jgi:hypothetical protein
MSELRPCPRFCKEDEWGEKVPTHMEHCEKNPVTKLVVENAALKAQVKRLKAPVSDKELQRLHDKYGWFEYGDAQGDVSRKFVNDLLSARTAAPTTGAGGRQRCG